MQSRYLRVRGVPGQLVAHPYADARRYLGKTPNNVPTWDAGPMNPETKAPRWVASEAVEEDIREDSEGYLRKAIRRGSLMLVARCVASSADEAKRLLDAEAARKKPAPVKSARMEK